MEQLFYLSLAGNLVLIIVLIVLIAQKKSQPKNEEPQQNPDTDKPQGRNNTKLHQSLEQPVAYESFGDTSLDDIANFIKHADWKTILINTNNFVPRAGSQHDKQVWKMLTDRLCQTEHPILADEFIQKHSSEIIWVETLSTNEEIKKAVADKWNTTPKIPAYVLRKNHQLVGFTLAPWLIIDGVNPRSVFASHIKKIVQNGGKSLLTKTDSKLVEKHFDILNSMMKKANVPQITNKNWMIESKNDYEGYNINHPKRYIYYEHDDYSLILAKL